MVFRPEVLENPSVDFNKMYNLFNFTVAQYPRKVWTKSYEQFSRKSSLQIMEFQLVTQWSELDCRPDFCLSQNCQSRLSEKLLQRSQ